jgi:hypothetical protein
MKSKHQQHLFFSIFVLMLVAAWGADYARGQQFDATSDDRASAPSGGVYGDQSSGWRFSSLIDWIPKPEFEPPAITEKIFVKPAWVDRGLASTRSGLRFTKRKLAATWESTKNILDPYPNDEPITVSSESKSSGFFSWFQSSQPEAPQTVNDWLGQPIVR